MRKHDAFADIVRTAIAVALILLAPPPRAEAGGPQSPPARRYADETLDAGARRTAGTRLERRQRRVLVLYDNDRLLPANVILDEQLQVAFRGDGSGAAAVDYFSEFIDAARIGGAEHEARQSRFLRDKYTPLALDLVVAAGPKALRFVLNAPGAGGRLFPGVPVVFCGIDTLPKFAGAVAGQPPPGVTGVHIRVYDQVEPTMELARRLMPQRRRLYLVGGTSDFDRHTLRRVRERAEQFRARGDLTGDIQEITDLPLREMLRRVAALPPDALVLACTTFRDSEGKSYQTREVNRRLATAANAPVVALYADHVGEGPLSAVGPTFAGHGKATGELALRVLAGESPDAIPPITPHPVTVIDAAQAERWGVSRRHFPPEAQVLNDVPSPWHVYRFHLLGGGTIVTAQFSLIAALFVHARRRRSAEEALQREHAFVRSALDALPGVFYVFDSAGHFLLWNHNLELATGYTTEEIRDMRPTDFVAESDRALIEARIARVFDSGSTSVEACLLCKDGREIPYYFTGRLLEFGGKHCVAGMGLDIADRKVAQAELARSEERLRLAAEAARLGLWSWDAESDAIELSPRAAHTLGLAERVVPLGAFLANLHSADREAVERAARGALAEGNLCDVECRLVPTPEGPSPRWLAIKGRRSGNAGTPDRLNGVLFEITERKRAEDELLRRREEIAHVTRVRAMGEMAGSIAHELNQPLGAILSNIGTAEILLAEPSPDVDELRSILADIRTDGQRAGEVVHSLRGLMKKREMEQQHGLNLNELIQGTVALIDADAHFRRVTVTIDLADDLPPVRGDRVHLQQVFINLMVNAMDAMEASLPRHRRLLIATRRAPAGAGGGAGRGAAVVEVADSGPGIPPDILPRIFDPFFTTKHEGMGMGLSIAHTIIDVHGGRIEAGNRPGGGAVFRVILGVTSGAAAAPEHDRDPVRVRTERELVDR